MLLYNNFALSSQRGISNKCLATPVHSFTRSQSAVIVSLFRTPSVPVPVFVSRPSFPVPVTGTLPKCTSAVQCASAVLSVVYDVVSSDSKCSIEVKRESRISSPKIKMPDC